MAHRYISLAAQAERLFQRHALGTSSAKYGLQEKTIQLTRMSKNCFSWLSHEWHTLKSEVPKGFEKYFPGGKKAQPKPEEPVKPNQPKESIKDTPKDPPSKSSGGPPKGQEKKFEFSFNLAK